MLASDVEFHVSGAFPDLDPVYRGHEGVKKLNDALNEPWVALSLDPNKFIDAGSRVLVLSQFHARGRDGMEVRFHLANLWTVRDGQIVRMEAFADHESALESVGLSEQEMSHESVRVENPVIRRWIWAFENDTPAFAAVLHPDIEWFPIDENYGRLAKPE